MTAQPWGLEVGLTGGTQGLQTRAEVISDAPRDSLSPRLCPLLEAAWAGWLVAPPPPSALVVLDPQILLPSSSLFRPLVITPLRKTIFPPQDPSPNHICKVPAAVEETRLQVPGIMV